jgi:hypothetical protein
VGGAEMTNFDYYINVLAREDLDKDEKRYFLAHLIAMGGVAGELDSFKQVALAFAFLGKEYEGD